MDVDIEALKELEEDTFDVIWQTVLARNVKDILDEFGVRRQVMQPKDGDYGFLKIRILAICHKRGLSSDFVFHRLVEMAKTSDLCKQMLGALFDEEIKSYKKTLNAIDIEGARIK